MLKQHWSGCRGGLCQQRPHPDVQPPASSCAHIPQTAPALPCRPSVTAASHAPHLMHTSPTPSQRFPAAPASLLPPMHHVSYTHPPHRPSASLSSHVTASTTHHISYWHHVRLRMSMLVFNTAATPVAGNRRDVLGHQAASKPANRRPSMLLLPAAPPSPVVLAPIC